MDLENFVKSTLVSIIGGIKQAQQSDSGGLIAPQVGGHSFPPNGVNNDQGVVSTVVQFEVAVSAEDTKSADAKAGIKVLSAQLGGSLETENKNSNISKIKFSVPLVMPINQKKWCE